PRSRSESCLSALTVVLGCSPEMGFSWNRSVGWCSDDIFAPFLQVARGELDSAPCGSILSISPAVIIGRGKPGRIRPANCGDRTPHDRLRAPSLQPMPRGDPSEAARTREHKGVRR